jgi:UDP-2,4-diacetamido-2,4,6-trideoxy-beta-L-altropyranose hydrolase
LRVLFLVEASKEIGLGHFIRMISLAHKLTSQVNNIEISFVLENDEFLFVKSKKIEIPFNVLEFSSKLIESLQGILSCDDILIIDGYNYSDSFEKSVSNFVKKVIRIDDVGELGRYADAIINPNPFSEVSWYKDFTPTKFFSGPAFILARDEFFNPPTNLEREGIVIMIGGTDPGGLTQYILNALEVMEYKETVKIVGAGESNKLKLKKLNFLSASEVVSLFDNSRSIFCSASGIALEALLRKRPVVLFKTEKNQDKMFESFRQFLASPGIDLTAGHDQEFIEDFFKKTYQDKDLFKSEELMEKFSQMDISLELPEDLLW